MKPSILITGAGGFIASFLCSRLLGESLDRLILLSLTESALYRLQSNVLPQIKKSSPSCQFVLGSVDDTALLEKHLPGVDLIIHAAAHKHVPLCELNPTSAINNNIGGTLTLVSQALAYNVPRLILVSTDKAVSPSSVMGATKNIAERLVIKAGYDVARLCNVYGSTGSVVPLWEEQARQGGPLTLTDPRCERYFHTPDDVFSLLQCIIAQPAMGRIYMIDPGMPLNMYALAQRIIARSGNICSIHTTGLRPGDKLTETLYTGVRHRLACADADGRVFCVDSPHIHASFDEDVFRLLTASRRHDVETSLACLWALASPSDV